MPRIISDPRHQRLLQREFGIRGGAASPHLESTIQPVTIVSTPHTQDQFSDAPFARRGACCRGFGGANFTLFELKNAVGSGMLLLPLRLWTAGGNADIFIGVI